MFLVDSLRVCLGQYSQPACIRMRCRSTGGFCQSGGRRGHRQGGRTFGTFASCSCGENWVANEKMRHQIRDVRKHDVHTRQLRGERFLVWQAIGWTWVYQSVFNLVQEDQCQTERKNNQHMFILKHTCNFIFPVSWVFDVFGTQVYVLLGLVWQINVSKSSNTIKAWIKSVSFWLVQHHHTHPATITPSQLLHLMWSQVGCVVWNLHGQTDVLWTGEGSMKILLFSKREVQLLKT